MIARKDTCEIKSMFTGDFSLILNNRCCFLPHSKRNISSLRSPCSVVGYGGNNVGALSKSATLEKKRVFAGQRVRRGVPEEVAEQGIRNRGKMKEVEDSERGREYWLTCNTESGRGRNLANIKYIITFILISLLAPVVPAWSLALP